MATSRPSTSYSYTLTSYQNAYTTSSQMPSGTRPNTARPSSGRRSRASSTFGGESQKIVCAVSEARGITPTIGLAFVNISTGEAVLSQVCDNQFYSRTLNKLQVFEPTEILIVSTSVPPNTKSKMYKVIEENIFGARIIPLDRKYWSELSGLEYITQLAFKEDVEAIKVSIGGNYFATCCFAAALKYIDFSMSLTFAFHSLRVKYQPSEGTMMIDLSTIQSLELIQNIQDAKAKECLFGLMNKTITPMGSRLLRSSILQPSTQIDVLNGRFDALNELSASADMFYQTRQALKQIYDIEKLLSTLIIIPKEPNIHYSEQSINNILMLKSFIQAIPPLFEALAEARSALLIAIRIHCQPEKIGPTLGLINEVINDDVTYQRTPLDLRNQRTYAVKSGVSGLLDVARQTYKEATQDVHQHVSELNEKFDIQAETRYDNSRRYWLRIRESDFDGRTIPDSLVNRLRKKGYIECQTLELMKLNQKIEGCHQEAILMSDKTIQTLLYNIRTEVPILYAVCESVALLDMIAGFCQLATDATDTYVRPEIADCIAIKSGRHPVREKIKGNEKFVPNDVFANQKNRFQIITGCNMSGKSTYIRSITLMCVMAQVGCFVPASYASFPIVHQLFARVSMDDSIEANVSTFALEMRETSFILRNIDKRSLAIIDELGRGTSTRDGLSIALSIAEALVDSKALVYFATHFRELAQILSQREGVVNMHLSVKLSENSMTMLYKIDEGYVKEEHYGLALARVVDLPPEVLAVAEEVSTSLESQIEMKKRSSRAFAIGKKRKLLLDLKTTLESLAKGPMADKPLRNFLKKLQDEFVARMEAIEAECRAASSDGSNEGSDTEEQISRIAD